MGDYRAGSQRWAAVTGASSGIGAAFARALSAEGFGVLLVARDLDATTAVAAELPGPVEVVIADLATSEGIARVESRLMGDGPPVSLLVNNAGTGRFGSFADQSPEDVTETITVNAVAVTRLARTALPRMIAAGHGGLITVSSLAGTAPVPMLAVYGATKAFVNALDASLRAELIGTPVTVTTVWPGWTRSNFHRRLDQDTSAVPAELWVSAEQVASEALRRHHLGHEVVRVPEPTLTQRVRGRARRESRRVSAPLQALIARVGLDRRDRSR